MASLDIAIDFGTSNMIAGNRKDGIVVREPTIVAINKRTDKVIGVGSEIVGMQGREHGNMEIIHPMKDGVISDYRLTQTLAKMLFKKVGSSMFFKPQVITCIPCKVTPLEAQSMIDTMLDAGAREVMLIQEPLAGAIGAGIDITKPQGHLLVDIGGGTTDVAVLSLGGVVACSSNISAGNAIDSAIERHMRNEHNVIIGTHTAENIKKEIVSFWKDSDEKSMEVKGRGIVTGLPTKVVLNRSSLYPAIQDIADGIIQCIVHTMEKTPPELAGDITVNGMYLTGGTSLVHGLDKMLENYVGVPVHLTEKPLDSPVLGALKAFDYLDYGKELFYTPETYY